MASSLRQGGTVFTFYPMVPEGPNGPLIQFRAHITNISDSYSPSWGEHMDMGRADPKFMYQSYSRNISVDFMTVAIERGEEITWIEALNSLSEMTKPIYKAGKGFNGIYTKMQIGALINEVGLLTNVDYTIDNESPWINDVPIYINASVAFRVIGNDKPNYKFKVNGGSLGTKRFGEGKAQ